MLQAFETSVRMNAPGSNQSINLSID